VRTVLIITICLTNLAIGQSYNVVFLGLADGGAPSIERHFEQKIREKIMAIDGVRLLEDLQTDKIKRYCQFDYPSVASRPLVEALKKSVDDSTILVWGRIEQLTFKPQRRWLLGTQAVAESRVRCTIYSLHFKSYIYTGTISARATIVKEPAFFRPVNLVTHISAQDQIALSEQIMTQIGDRISSVLSIITRNFNDQAGPVAAVPVLEREKVPSIENLFEIPSMDGSELELPDQSILKPAPVAEEPPNPAPETPVPAPAQ
jgi:hypothetical protein